MPDDPAKKKTAKEQRDSKEAEGGGENGANGASGTRRRRYTRTPSSGPLLLSAEHMLVLRFLAECRFLSLPQVARLIGVPEKGTRRRLRVLFDAGLVDVVPVSRVALAPTDAPNDSSLLFGSAPNIYALTASGSKASSKEWTAGGGAGHKTPTYGPKNGLFLAHELAVRDVRVWLEGVRRATGPGPQVGRWQVGQEAWIEVGEPANRASVRPDAWFAYELNGGARPVVLVGLAEIDRGTERGDRHWWAKMNGYRRLFEEQEALTAATGYVNARVLVFTPNVQRRDRLAVTLVDLVQQANLPYEFLSHFWLAEHAVLSGDDLAAPVWRRPGVSALLPLVSPKVLASARADS